MKLPVHYREVTGKLRAADRVAGRPPPAKSIIRKRIGFDGRFIPGFRCVSCGFFEGCCDPDSSRTRASICLAGLNQIPDLKFLLSDATIGRSDDLRVPEVKIARFLEGCLSDLCLRLAAASLGSCRN